MSIQVLRHCPGTGKRIKPFSVRPINTHGLRTLKRRNFSVQSRVQNRVQNQSRASQLFERFLLETLLRKLSRKTRRKKNSKCLGKKRQPSERMVCDRWPVHRRRHYQDYQVRTVQFGGHCSSEWCAGSWQLNGAETGVPACDTINVAQPRFEIDELENEHFTFPLLVNTVAHFCVFCHRPFLLRMLFESIVLTQRCRLDSLNGVDSMDHTQSS